MSYSRAGLSRRSFSVLVLVLSKMSRVVNLSHKSHHCGHRPVKSLWETFPDWIGWIIDVDPKRWITTLWTMSTLELYSTGSWRNTPTISLFRYLFPDRVNNVMFIWWLGLETRCLGLDHLVQVSWSHHWLTSSGTPKRSRDRDGHAQAGRTQ